MGRVSWGWDSLGKARYDSLSQESDSKEEECVINADGPRAPGGTTAMLWRPRWRGNHPSPQTLRKMCEGPDAFGPSCAPGFGRALTTEG